MAEEKHISSLAEVFAATQRWHPSLGNVLTHISSTNWRRSEDGIAVLFDPASDVRALTPLTQNVLEPVCDNNGTTGRIMQSFLLAFPARNIDKEEATRIKQWIWCLRDSRPDHADAPRAIAPDRHGTAFNRRAS